MFEIYYSEDRGLLDSKVLEFNLKHDDVTHLRRCSLEELEVNLFQTSLLRTSKAFIVDDCLISIEALESILKSLDPVYEIMVLFNSKETALETQIFPNKDYFLERLNHRTKRSYLSFVLDLKNIKIPKFFLDLIKDNIPASAIHINEISENVKNMQSSGILNEENLKLMLDTIREPNYFSFLEIYIRSKDFEWMEFLNKNIENPETLNKFSYSLSYKLLELKYGPFGIKDKSYYFYSSLKKEYGSFLNEWLNRFIIELYFFYSYCFHSYEINLSFLKYFLVFKKEELLNDR